jgi:hypothetical protein
MIVEAASATDTDATGTGRTTSTACPLIPSLVAMMFAVPGATAVTRPVAASTVAIAGSLELQVTTRPASTSLFASRVIAVAFVVVPAMIVEAVSATVTEATATGMTVRDACPAIPSLVAMMFAEPGAIAVITPVVALTVAIATLLELQVAERPVRALLLASRVTPAAVVDPPAIIVDAPRVTVTEATGTGSTSSVACPLMPSLVAMMFAVPGATPVTTPVLASTVTIATSLELHMMVRPKSTLFEASWATAVAVVVVPVMIVEDPSVTETDATGSGTTTRAAWPPIPSLVAMRFAIPGATAVTVPLAASTVATAGSLELHTIERPARTLLLASRVTAVTVVDVPAMIVDAARVTVTEATGTGTTTSDA